MKPKEVFQRALENLTSNVKAMFFTLAILEDAICFEVAIKLPFLKEAVRKCVILVDGDDGVISVSLCIVLEEDGIRSTFETLIDEIKEEDTKDLLDFFDMRISTDWLKMRILELKPFIMAHIESYYKQLEEDYDKIKLMAN